MIGIAAQSLQVTAGEDNLSQYRFHSGQAVHFFCKSCGIYTFHQRRGDSQAFAVNAACLADSNLYADYPLTPVYDGQNHASDNGGEFRVAGTLRYEPSEVG